MKKFLALSLFFALILGFSCTDYDDNLTGVQLRVRNSSGLTFDEVEVVNLKYGKVAEGKTTPYKELLSPQPGDEPVPYAISATIDSLDYYELFDLETDSVGLQLFTFEIDAVTEESGLEFKILED